MIFNQDNNQIRNWVIFAFVVAVGVTRVLMSANADGNAWANFTPIGAMALYGGAYFTGNRRFAFPLITLWVSDIFLNRFIYFGEWVILYDGFMWTYGAFFLMVLVGQKLLKKVTAANFVLSSLVIVLIHWIVTDFGVWIGTTMYPKTLGGFIACLTAAIPFERNFLAGTLIYGVVMFGSFEWLTARFPSIRLKRAKS